MTCVCVVVVVGGSCSIVCLHRPTYIAGFIAGHVCVDCWAIAAIVEGVTTPGAEVAAMAQRAVLPEIGMRRDVHI